jgi:hypothetical protein
MDLCKSKALEPKVKSKIIQALFEINELNDETGKGLSEQSHSVFSNTVANFFFT